ncbi:LutC/YkgG family protein [Agriterribacter sp.]|uniref:LutC/YkgG family protein n=1 Tax=Agriterribacter sp. TaxID=2821509 RepID=UPI002CF575EA|nr:LUD domain-containing protein [Agriterribacter sp.]HTN08001.1 LUD domain-containing protein [Agriterribacter sp.]
MNSRERILGAVKNNQPAQSALPELQSFLRNSEGTLQQYAATLTAIGGVAHIVNSYAEIESIIGQEYKGAQRIISLCKALPMPGNQIKYDDPHELETADLAIISAAFGVAENGAVWITDDMLPQRVLPFITQQLAVIIKRTDIVPTMHHAYERIGNADYGFGVFIAGPSKTADIEQSLVLGAHGPKTMRVFIL